MDAPHFSGCTCRLKLQRCRIRQSIRRVDHEGLNDRRSLLNRRVQRRVYSSPFPHFLWHIDGNHKLIRWKFIIHAAIDGFSRSIIYLQCSNNNEADTVLSLFVKSVEDLGLRPRKVRADLGVENQGIINLLGSDVLLGSSVHNQRVERLNRDINSNIRNQFCPIFYALENENVLDIDDKLDMAVLHYIFLPSINKSLQLFKNTHNHHPIRTENNATPDQLISRYIHLYEPPEMPIPHTASTDDDIVSIDLEEDAHPATNTLLMHVSDVLHEAGFDPNNAFDGVDGVAMYKNARRHLLEIL